MFTTPNKYCSSLICSIIWPPKYPLFFPISNATMPYGREDKLYVSSTKMLVTAELTSAFACIISTMHTVHVDHRYRNTLCKLAIALTSWVYIASYTYVCYSLQIS